MKQEEAKKAAQRIFHGSAWTRRIGMSYQIGTWEGPFPRLRGHGTSWQEAVNRCAPDGRKEEAMNILGSRKLTDTERERLASARGVTDLAVTCEGDQGYGPCGTYTEWLDGRCAEGHEIEILTTDEQS